MEINSRLKSALTLTGALAFFFGFPVFGLVWFRADMHRKIEAEAKTDAARILGDVFAHGPSALRKHTVQSSLDKLNDEEMGALIRRVGKLKTLPELTPLKSWVEQRQEQMWQVTSLTGPVSGVKGNATVELVIIRPHVEPAWRVRTLKIYPGR
jgi:hypothetical protein